MREGRGFDRSCSICFPDAHKKRSNGAATSKKVPPSCPHLFRKGKNQYKLKKLQRNSGLQYPTGQK